MRFMKYLFLPLFLLLFLSGCDYFDQGTDVVCVPGYEKTENGCVEAESLVCDGLLVDTNGECLNYPSGTVFYETSDGYEKSFSPYDNNVINDYIVYYRNMDTVHCDYFKEVDIVYDMYYTEDNRYGYDGIVSGTCHVELFIAHDEEIYTLFEVFLEGILSIEDFENAELTIELRTQALEEAYTHESFGQFGSIVKEFEYDGIYDLYYMDYTGYTCVVSDLYINFGDVNASKQSISNGVRTGTNCGSSVYIKDDNGYLRQIEFEHTNVSGSISNEEVIEIYESLGYFFVEERVVTKNIESIEVYELRSEETFSVYYKIIMNDEFLELFEDAYETFRYFTHIDSRDPSGPFNVKELFEENGKADYHFYITFDDGSTLDLYYDNGIFHDRSTNEYMINGMVGTFWHFAIYFDEDFVYYEIDNYKE